MLIRAGSTPVTRTTGSAGPKHRGLTLLTFSSAPDGIVLLSILTKRQCRQPNVAVCAAEFLYFAPEIFILSIDKPTKECYYLNAYQNFYF